MNDNKVFCEECEHQCGSGEYSICAARNREQYIMRNGARKPFCDVANGRGNCSLFSPKPPPKVSKWLRIWNRIRGRHHWNPKLTPYQRGQLAYYMGLDYEVEVRGLTPEDGGGYIATIPLLGRMSVTGAGDTIHEAIEIMKEVKETILTMMLEDGDEIPEPDVKGALDV